ncbi:MAG: isochorismatase family protein [Syntrophobacteraceae bacterium]
MNKSLELLDPRDCILLLVDIQKSLLDLCVDRESIPGNAGALIEIARIFEIPVLFTVQNPDKLGGVLPELIQKVPQTELPKLEFNCFENEVISGAVRSAGRKTLLLAGIEGHVCIFQTAVGALRLGYTVHVAADAVTSRSKLNREIGLHRIEKAGAVISSAEVIIFELLKQAGTPEFKAALPLLKNLQSS